MRPADIIESSKESSVRAPASIYPRFQFASGSSRYPDNGTGPGAAAYPTVLNPKADVCLEAKRLLRKESVHDR